MTGVYIHWPFCKSKCPYCDFNSHVAAGSIDHKAWLNAYLQEIDYYASYLNKQNISSIFFGGGTPSLMDANIIEAIINRLIRIYKVKHNVEITLEANPTSSENKKFKAFKNAGINRISIGVQAFNEADLSFLGREHSSKQALNAITMANETFDRFSFDLIYARPQQSLLDWEKELTTALKYTSSHISLYQLTIEKGTKFFSDYKKKVFTMPDEELAAKMYLLTNSIMQHNDIPLYEISNYAKKGHECRHNVNYWQYGDYLGIGPGAHGRISIDGKKHAIMNIHNPANWLNSIKLHSHGIQNRNILKKDEIIKEAVLMGMRLKKGIDKSRFKQTTHYDFDCIIAQDKINFMQKNGFLINNKNNIRLTTKAFPLANTIIEKML